jgi:hypothetical protein
VSEVTPPPAALPGQEPFQTNKTLAIIAIVVGVITCGCLTLILGILGLVFANKAQTLWSAGDIEGARSAASTARVFSIIAFILVVIWLIAVIFSWSVGGIDFRVGR